MANAADSAQAQEIQVRNRQREADRRYKLRNASLLREKARRNRKDNPDKVRAASARWREKYPDRQDGFTRAWRKANKDRVKKVKALWEAKNAIKRTAQREQWRRDNPDRVKQHGRKRRSVLKYRIEASVRAVINHHVGKKRTGETRTFELLGYTVEDLIKHLERQFTKGMSWENYGKDGWSIDHRIPLISFDYVSRECPSFKAAWALTNLQPLWATENSKKGGRRILLI